MLTAFLRSRPNFQECAVLKPCKIAMALAVALFVPQLAVSSATAARPARGPVDPPVPSIPQRYLDQPITWSACDFDAAIKAGYPQAPTTNCALVNVPMDWNHPNAHP